MTEPQAQRSASRRSTAANLAISLVHAQFVAAAQRSSEIGQPLTHQELASYAAAVQLTGFQARQPIRAVAVLLDKLTPPKTGRVDNVPEPEPTNNDRSSAPIGRRDLDALKDGRINGLATEPDSQCGNRLVDPLNENDAIAVVMKLMTDASGELTRA